MIKYYMCTKCFSIYKVEYPDIAEIIPNNSRKVTIDVKVVCRKIIKTKGKESKCNRTAVEIDRKILYAIQNLNIKGYITQYCCSGHNEKYTIPAYILFDKCMYPMIENIGYPEGWLPRSVVLYLYDIPDDGKLDNDSLKVTFDPRPGIRHKEILDNEYIYALNRWVDSLPSLK